MWEVNKKCVCEEIQSVKMSERVCVVYHRGSAVRRKEKRRTGRRRVAQGVAASTGWINHVARYLAGCHGNAIYMRHPCSSSPLSPTTRLLFTGQSVRIKRLALAVCKCEHRHTHTLSHAETFQSVTLLFSAEWQHVSEVMPGWYRVYLRWHTLTHGDVFPTVCVW